MNTKMFVGNLPFEVTEQELRDLFTSHGPVKEVTMVMDRETSRPRGFAFVSMETVEGMEAAIQELDGKDFNGRSLKVDEARPRENRSFDGGGGGGGGGGGYGGGGKSRGGGSRKGNQGRDRW